MALIKCSECGKEISSKAKTCPHCGTTPKKKTGCLTVLACAIVVFFAVGVISRMNNPGGVNQSTASRVSSPAKNAAPTPQAELPRVTAVGLQREYEANEVAANAKYGKKEVIITGVIAGISETIMGDPEITLSSASFLPISVGLGSESREAAAQLSKGKKVAFRCTVKGFYVGTVSLDDCAFAE